MSTDADEWWLVAISRCRATAVRVRVALRCVHACVLREDAGVCVVR